MTPPVLRVISVTKEYALRQTAFRRRGHVTAVADVTFTLAKGEKLGIVGESGSGKSTLARVIMGLTVPDAGSVLFDDRDIVRLRGAEMRALRAWIQTIFQDPYSSLDPTKTVQQLIEEPLKLHSAAGRDQRASRAKDLLQAVALPHSALHLWPAQLSGGQRQRVAIARALAPGPELIIADEPVSALDVSTQAQVVNLLNELADVHLLSMVVVSHDLRVVRQMTDTIAIMFRGRFVEVGATRSIYRHPAHPYTQALLAAVPRMTSGERNVADRPLTTTPFEDVQSIDGHDAYDRGCSFRSRCTHAMAICAEVLPVLTDRVGTTSAVACHLYESTQATCRQRDRPRDDGVSAISPPADVRSELKEGDR